MEKNWRLEALFGKENCIKYNWDPELLFKNINTHWWVCKNNSHLFASNTPLFREEFGFLGYMDGYQAYKRYGLGFLERVSEAGYEATSMAEYYNNKE